MEGPSIISAKVTTNEPPQAWITDIFGPRPSKVVVVGACNRISEDQSLDPEERFVKQTSVSLRVMNRDQPQDVIIGEHF